jgi:hypothetical protein
LRATTGTYRPLTALVALLASFRVFGMKAPRCTKPRTEAGDTNIIVIPPAGAVAWVAGARRFYNLPLPALSGAAVEDSDLPRKDWATGRVPAGIPG